MTDDFTGQEESSLSERFKSLEHRWPWKVTSAFDETVDYKLAGLQDLR